MVFLKRLLLFAGSLLLLVIAFVWFVFAYQPKPNNKERLFIQNITTQLKAPGDTMPAANVYPGEWTIICIMRSDSLSASVSEAILREKLPIEGTIKFANGVHDASDTNSLAILFFPPNTVEMLKVRNDRAFVDAYVESAEGLPPCRKKDQAHFSVLTNPNDPDFRYFRLTKNNTED